MIRRLVLSLVVLGSLLAMSHLGGLFSEQRGRCRSCVRATRDRRTRAVHPVRRCGRVEGPVRVETARDVIRRVAVREHVPAEVLLAMAYHESRFDSGAVGDGGRSHGVFQIQARLHGLSIAQCRNVEYAATWTARRLKRHPGGIWAGVRAHNGAGPRARSYAARVRSTADHWRADG